MFWGGFEGCFWLEMGGAGDAVPHFCMFGGEKSTGWFEMGVWGGNDSPSLKSCPSRGAVNYFVE